MAMFAQCEAAMKDIDQKLETSVLQGKADAIADVTALRAQLETWSVGLKQQIDSAMNQNTGISGPPRICGDT